MEHQSVAHAASAGNAQSGVAQNRFELRGDYAVIFAPQRGVTLHEVKIDVSDLDAVLASGFWRVAEFCKKSHKFYCYRPCNRRNLYLHRFLALPPADKIVDHMNGDTLDNRRSNIRVASETLNQLNRLRAQSNSKTGYRGVSPENGKFLARYDQNDKTIRLGLYSDPLLACLRVHWELVTLGLIPVGKVSA